MTFDCACLVSCEDADYEYDWEISDTTANTEQVRKCIECGKSIGIGDLCSKYTQTECDEEGMGRATGRELWVCADCRSVSDALCCGYVIGAVYDDIREAVIEMGADNFPFAKLADLTPIARAKVCEIVEEAWRDEEAAEEARTVA